MLHFLCPVIKQWFFPNLRILDCMDVSAVPVYDANARPCHVEWSSYGEQSWFPYEYDEDMSLS